MEMPESLQLLDLLKEIDLPVEDYAVFGSGPMYAHGIKGLGHDLDLIARGSAWEKAKNFGTPKNKFIGQGTVIELFNGAIEIFDSWTSESWNVNELIDTAELIDGIKWVSLENVLKWKKEMNRPKDAEHIRLIEDYIRLRNV